MARKASRLKSRTDSTPNEERVLSTSSCRPSLLSPLTPKKNSQFQLPDNNHIGYDESRDCGIDSHPQSGIDDEKLNVLLRIDLTSSLGQKMLPSLYKILDTQKYSLIKKYDLYSSRAIQVPQQQVMRPLRSVTCVDDRYISSYKPRRNHQYLDRPMLLGYKSRKKVYHSESNSKKGIRISKIKPCYVKVEKLQNSMNIPSEMEQWDLHQENPVTVKSVSEEKPSSNEIYTQTTDVSDSENVETDSGFHESTSSKCWSSSNKIFSDHNSKYNILINTSCDITQRTLRMVLSKYSDAKDSPTLMRNSRKQGGSSNLMFAWEDFVDGTPKVDIEVSTKSVSTEYLEENNVISKNVESHMYGADYSLDCITKLHNKKHRERKRRKEKSSRRTSKLKFVPSPGFCFSLAHL